MAKRVGNFFFKKAWLSRIRNWVPAMTELFRSSDIWQVQIYRVRLN